MELCPDLVAELEPESVGVIVEAEDSRLLQSACSFILQILARSSTRFPMCDPELISQRKERVTSDRGSLDNA